MIIGSFLTISNSYKIQNRETLTVGLTLNKTDDKNLRRKQSGEKEAFE